MTPAVDGENPLKELRKIVAQLRAPGGCPWDREQTHSTLRSGLIEESYEVIEAIDNQDDALLCEELGDLLLQVVMHSQIAAEDNRFDLDNVASGISAKLIRRHPHVFGDATAGDTNAVLKQWDQIKREEKGTQTSVLSPTPVGFPALMKAEKIQKSAARVGFDWDDMKDVISKVREELDEVEEAAGLNDKTAMEEEVGDLLFSVVNLARHLKLDAELALHGATNKFVRRFEKLEALLKRQNKEFKQITLAELDEVWNQVKSSE